MRVYGFWVAVAALAFLAPSTASAADPWLEPYSDGAALWHFDEGTGSSPSGLPGGAEASLVGSAKIDRAQKMHGAASARLAGGSIVIDKLPWTAADRSLEAFVKVRSYPRSGRESTLFTFVNAKGEAEHVLALTPRGGLKLTYMYRDGYNERWEEHGSLELGPGSVPRGEWTHVSLHALGYYHMVRLCVNGKILGEEFGDMFGRDYRLVVGNSQDGTAPFAGWIDELRCASERSVPARQEPQNWLRPGSPPRRMTDARFFPNARQLSLYCAFDGTLEPTHAVGDASHSWAWKGVPPRFGEGIHGKAMVLGGVLSYPGKAKLRPAAGSVSCWIWFKSSTAELGRFFNFGYSWDFMLSGSHGFYASTPRGPMAIGGSFQHASPRRWHHVALTWLGEHVTLYLDGRETNVYVVPGGVERLLAKDSAITMGDTWVNGYPAEDLAFIDEYRVYRTALPAEEIANIHRAETGEKLAPVRAKRASFSVYPGARKIVAVLDHGLDGAASGEGFSLSLASASGRQIARTADADVSCGVAELELEFPALPKGDYVVRLTRAGSRPPVADTYVYRHEDYPWMRKHVGLSDRVLPPWTPVEAGRDTVSVWNRKIVLDGAALPRAIEVGGEALLAGPAYFELELPDGNVRRLKAARAAPEKRSATPAKAHYRGRALGEGVAVTVDNETEYDGCSRMTLTLAPGSRAREVKRLTLVIPLDRKSARYINAKGKGIRESYLTGALPQAAGRVFASYILPACWLKSDPLKILADVRRADELIAAGTKPWDLPEPLKYAARGIVENSSGSFMPYLWVGSPARGLCWFADTDRGWVRGDHGTPAVEIVQKEPDARTEVRINLVASPVTITEPRTIVFGLMATPVKPLEPDWRKHYWFRKPRIMGFGDEFVSGRYYLGRGCPGAYGGEPFPWDPERAKWYAKIAKAKDWLQVPYMEFTNTYADIPPHVDREWRTQPAKWHIQGGIRPVDSYADWFCYHYDKYIKDVGLDGVYLDNVCPVPSLDTHAHGAWRDESGQLQASFNLWELREMLRRIRTIFLDNGVEHPWIQLHMSHANLIPATAYADVLYDGEDFYLGPQDTDDFMDRWPFDAIAAIDNPHTWGVPTAFLGHLNNSWWPDNKLRTVPALRSGLAAQLQIDLRGGSWEVNDVFESMRRWGVDKADCSFIGYWEERFHSEDPDVMVGAYHRPDALLLVVSNTARQGKTPTVRFSPEGLLGFAAGFALLSDAETVGNPVGVRQGPIDLALKRSHGGDWLVTAGPIRARDFRLVAVGRSETERTVETVDEGGGADAAAHDGGDGASPSPAETRDARTDAAAETPEAEPSTDVAAPEVDDVDEAPPAAAGPSARPATRDADAASGDPARGHEATWPAVAGGVGLLAAIAAAVVVSSRRSRSRIRRSGRGRSRR